MVMRVTVHLDDHEQWWVNFALACEDAEDFEQQLRKNKIELNELGSNLYELVFDSEQDYVMFKLRWI